MRSYWQVEFTDTRGSTVRYNFKFTTRPDAERFIASQRRPNLRAIEIFPDPPRFEEPESQPESVDRDPGDETAAIEGDESLSAAELTRQRKVAALQKARAAKAAKRAARLNVSHETQSAA